MTQDLDLSIIIVNWNSVAFLKQCLQSVYAEQRAFTFEIVVIDNASFDGSASMLASEFPLVRFLQGRENVGFARANNAASEACSGRHYLFLNPDTEVIGNALERMLSFIDVTPGAGAVGCTLLNTDGSLQTSCIQAYPTILNQLFDAEVLRRMFPKAGWWGMRALFEKRAEPAEVEVISGACLLVSRVAFEAAGRFTPDYFMYCEDVDLCFKLNGAGLRNYYLGDARVTHHGGQSTSTKGESQFANVMMRESIALFLRRYRGAFHAGVYRTTVGCAAIARLLLIWTGVVLSGRAWRRDAPPSGLRKWSTLLRWALGKEEWATNLRLGSG